MWLGVAVKTSEVELGYLSSSGYIISLQFGIILIGRGGSLSPPFPSQFP
jgi:hypothetical protein